MSRSIKSGNDYLRRVLVEAAWQYNYPFKISAIDR
jgi:hypothetical protein